MNHLPSPNELANILSSNTPHQIAEAIQNFPIPTNDPAQYILAEKQKEKLISIIYSNMQADDFAHLQSFAILPSRDLMLKMIDNGISLPLALVLLYNYRVQDVIQSIIIEDQKKQLVELIYSRMQGDDFL
jgi:Holliday junction resolvasome RuvABC DNA-binding subunit